MMHRATWQLIAPPSQYRRRYAANGYRRSKRPRLLLIALGVASFLLLALGGTAVDAWHIPESRRRPRRASRP